MAERITNNDFDQKIINFSGLALVDFYSDTCVPCKRMSPILAALENKYSNALYIAKVNIAYEKELVEKYEIRSTPTFLLFKNGKLIERFSGARKKDELEQLIELNL